MNDFRNFTQVKTNELFVTRHKWFCPYYELTDGQFIYGKLSYKGIWKRHAIIETADGLWTLKIKGWFNNTMLLNEGEDKTIGSVKPSHWKRDTSLKLNNGFEATYIYKKLFSKSLTLTNSTDGDILEVRQKTFSMKKPFEVTISPQKQKSKLNLPLFALIGASTILLRQAQASAAAGAGA
jgi:hypothetical protein